MCVQYVRFLVIIHRLRSFPPPLSVSVSVVGILGLKYGGSRWPEWNFRVLIIFSKKTLGKVKSFISCLLKESRVYGLILYNLCYSEKWSCFAYNNLVFSLHLVKSNQNMSSKILLTLEVGVIILMFRMFYIEIETKNVFPSFDVSKLNLKPCSNARG